MRTRGAKCDSHQAIDELEVRPVSHRYPKVRHQLSELNLEQIFRCDLTPKRVPINVRVAKDLARSTLGGNDGSHNLEELHRDWMRQNR